VVVFNAVVTTCLQCVGPALRKLLRTGANAKPKERVAQLKKNKKWKVLHVPVRNYLTGVTEVEYCFLDYWMFFPRIFFDKISRFSVGGPTSR
jgi:hypothetical protein